MGKLRHGTGGTPPRLLSSPRQAGQGTATFQAGKKSLSSSAGSWGEPRHSFTHEMSPLLLLPTAAGSWRPQTPAPDGQTSTRPLARGGFQTRLGSAVVATGKVTRW